MISNRMILVCITLFLVMVMNGSTAPVDRVDEVVTTEGMYITSALPDVVTDKLLFFKVTALHFDKSIKMKDFLYYKQGVLPVISDYDKPRSVDM